jgi:hypothetical protein
MDKNKVYIFDDFLTIKQQDFIELEINLHTLWRWRRSYYRTSKGKIQVTPPEASNYQKTKVKDNLFWDQYRPGQMHGEYYDINNGWSRWGDQKSITLPLDTLDLKYDIQRVKVNTNPKENPKNKNSCYAPHIDIENGGGWTGVYYVNDSDGDTVIFNELTMSPIRNNEEISVKQVIQNKRGRLVIFNQDSLHAGCPPIESDNRVIINYNFKI